MISTGFDGVATVALMRINPVFQPENTGKESDALPHEI
tara:strand:+ start:565 stop:678 length:114 start_codon:yes stop_codon:yes gene_type:complete